jgi:hypothetical protein
VTGRTGVALVVALLTLAAISTLVLGTLMIVQLDIRLASNRQSLALGRAEAGSRLTLLLLRLEADSQGGELPVSAPPMEGLLAYSRESPTVAVVSIVSGTGPGGYRRDARIELRLEEGIWRVHVVETR